VSIACPTTLLGTLSLSNGQAGSYIDHLATSLSANDVWDRGFSVDSISMKRRFSDLSAKASATAEALARV
jgi:hypothetical protein